MSLVFAAIAPHGTLPEAPVPGAEKTHEALAELGRRFDAATPEASIVLTPHNADSTPEGLDFLNEGAVENAVAFLEGKPQNVVNR